MLSTIKHSILFLLVSISAFEQSWSAYDKMKYIWSEIEKTKGDNAWWLTPFRQMAVMFEHLPLQFDYKSDFAQGSWYTFTLFPRIKTIHAKGVVQKIRWANTGGH